MLALVLNGLRLHPTPMPQTFHGPARHRPPNKIKTTQRPAWHCIRDVRSWALGLGPSGQGFLSGAYGVVPGVISADKIVVLAGCSMKHDTLAPALDHEGTNWAAQTFATCSFGGKSTCLRQTVGLRRGRIIDHAFRIQTLLIREGRARGRMWWLAM